MESFSLMQEMMSLPPASHHSAEGTAVPRKSRFSNGGSRWQSPHDATLGAVRTSLTWGISTCQLVLLS